MRHIAAAVVLVVLSASSCTRQASSEPAQSLEPSAALMPSRSPQPGPVRTFFDGATAERIMAARAAYDAAEAAALAEVERRVGAYANRISVSREQYVRHLAGPEQPVTRSRAWLDEQRRRSAHARSITDPKLAAARTRLEEATLSALSDFFSRERQAGRIASRDYRRYTSEMRQGYFPPFRPRKWSGPAVHEFRGGVATPEYRRVLQEVRKLWQAQGRGSPVETYEATPDLYSRLVPRERDEGAKRR